MPQQKPKSNTFDSDAFLKQLTERPGVYQMVDEQGCVLYVGKARNLKKRVSSYFKENLDSAKTKALMSHVSDIQIVITETENEALLLECHLIKEKKPRYNILMRDDKSYPYIFISNDTYPRIVFHRGAKREKGEYFGPFPSTTAVRETLNLLQKLFPVRQCANAFFRSRSRPCLQYQIGRCSAPCVGKVSKDEYALDLQHARLFLKGKDSKVIDVLTKMMDSASANQRYEEAALYRDKVGRLRKIQEQQCVTNLKGEADVFALARDGVLACIHVFSVRKGRLHANQNYFPRIPKNSSDAEILNAFVSQYYLSSKQERSIPSRVITMISLEDQAMLMELFSAKEARKVVISQRATGERATWLTLAIANAKEALGRALSEEGHYKKRLDALRVALDLPSNPARIECFDISHSSGDKTVASCVVFDGEGPRKSDYRRFNIRDITKGDDYEAMRQVLMRRYKKVLNDEVALPDIVLIDGGKGQLKKAVEVMNELNCQHCVLLSISKGRSRKPGLEVLHMPSKPDFTLPADSPALHLLQHIRDEAHRFAITGHRQQLAKVRKTSVLESISGIGAVKRRELLRHFGGSQGVKTAGLADLRKVPGISRQLAQKIYDAFHGGSED